MAYDPRIHHRRSIRLKDYDYSQAGLYFITICCQDRLCRFGKIIGNVIGAGVAGAGVSPAPTMVMNEFGQIAHDQWLALPNRFPTIELGEFQIMPNHMHGIIIIRDADAPTIGDIVGAYKSLVANGCLAIHKSRYTVADENVGAGLAPALVSGKNADERAGKNANERAGASPAPTTIPPMGKLWQRNYYEHIIRSEQAHQRIADYIVDNPARWYADKFFTATSQL